MFSYLDGVVRHPTPCKLLETPKMPLGWQASRREASQPLIALAFPVSDRITTGKRPSVVASALIEGDAWVKTGAAAPRCLRVMLRVEAGGVRGCE